MNPYKNLSDEELDREIEKKCGKDVWRKRDFAEILYKADRDLCLEFADRVSRGP